MFGSRMFSSTARALIRWTGFDRKKLQQPFLGAVNTFTGPDGGAEQRLGPVEEVHIKSRDDNPVHQSHFNPDDKAWVISARIHGQNGVKTCHIYSDGTGTTKKGESPK